ncbi:MAG: single-stranded DNA-binding protein [Galactobacter sp.]
MNEPIITVIGNLTNDPELAFVPSGAAVANFTIASTPRTFNKQKNEYEDGETLFLRAAIWREAAENVAESLTKGMRVIAQGRLKSRSFQTKEGENRTVTELDVDEIGPSLKYATAKVTRATKNGNTAGGFGQQDPGASQSWTPQQGQPDAGNWGTPQQPAADGWGTLPATSAPPF